MGVRILRRGTLLAMGSRNIVFTCTVFLLLLSRIILSSTHQKKSIGPEQEDACPATKSNAECSIKTPTQPAKTSSSSEIAVKNDGGNLFELIYGSFSGAIQTVFKTAKHTGEKLYSTLQNTTGDYIEGVRQVLREEFYDLIINGFSNVVGTAIAPGKSNLSNNGILN